MSTNSTICNSNIGAILYDDSELKNKISGFIKKVNEASSTITDTEAYLHPRRFKMPFFCSFNT